MAEEWDFYERYTHAKGIGLMDTPLARLTFNGPTPIILINRLAREHLASDWVTLGHKRGRFTIAPSARGLTLTSRGAHLWGICAQGFSRKHSIAWPDDALIDLIPEERYLTGYYEPGRAGKEFRFLANAKIWADNIDGALMGLAAHFRALAAGEDSHLDMLGHIEVLPEEEHAGDQHSSGHLE